MSKPGNLDTLDPCHGRTAYRGRSQPLLAWREPIYITAGFAGVISMCLLLIQPLLADRLLPGLTPVAGRHWHRWCGLALVAAILIHVGGLWITSPPDVIDALLFVSPTPFSAWGVIAMWAAFGAAFLGLFSQAPWLKVSRLEVGSCEPCDHHHYWQRRTCPDD